MTQIYFVRHAEPNYRDHDDIGRELTPQGMADRELVTAFLLDKGIDAVLSSPYRRAVDTVQHFAIAVRLPVVHVSGFRERQIANEWIEDFTGFSRRQWADFDYALPGGECLRAVQERNIAALRQVLTDYAGQRVVIGGHGTAISTVLDYYDPSFGYDGFERIRRLMPWIVRLDFDGTTFLGMEEFRIKG